MRLMKREAKRRAFIISAAATIGVVIVAGVFVAGFRLLEDRYKTLINESNAKALALENKIVSCTRSVYKANCEIKAGEQITAEKLEAQQVLTSMDARLYMQESEIGSVSRIDIEAGTFIVSGMLYKEGEALRGTNEIGYSSLRIPDNISEGDIVDVRISYPNGEEFIVLSLKKVEMISEASVAYMRLNEKELLMMASALNDESVMKANVYMVKNCLVDEGNRININYLPSEQVLNLIEVSPESGFTADRESIIRARKELEIRVLGGEE